MVFVNLTFCHLILNLNLDLNLIYLEDRKEKIEERIQ